MLSPKRNHSVAGTLCSEVRSVHRIVALGRRSREKAPATQIRAINQLLQYYKHPSITKMLL